MKNLTRFLSYVVVAAVASCATLFLCRWVPLSGDGNDKLEQLAAIIEERFIGEIDSQQMYDAAADAMIDSLGDRWSHYLPASDYKSHMEQMNNAYVGIGVTVKAREDGHADITKVDEDGAAFEAGILPGDIITAVEGQSVKEIGINGMKELIRGKEGTQVTLQLLRGEATLEITVTRQTIRVVVASGEMLGGDTGLVQIVNFDSRCASETIAAIEDLLAQGAKQLIFDVRNNPGGYKSELVKVLDYLLPEGPLFRSEDYRGVTAVDESDADHLDIPMAVLVNGNSYSAAEFFAAALGEYDAAVIVGEPTSGKGYFQHTYDLVDGSGVAISVGKYTTPNGVSLEGVGITPDVLVPVDDQTAAEIYSGTLAPEEDSQILAALKALKAS